MLISPVAAKLPTCEAVETEAHVILPPMERQELIKKIEQLPPNQLAEVEKFVESIASGERELARERIHQAIAEYAMIHAGTDVDLPLMEEHRASVKKIVEEVIEEAALARAIDEGQNTQRVTREEIFNILESTQ